MGNISSQRLLVAFAFAAIIALSVWQGGRGIAVSLAAGAMGGGVYLLARHLMGE